MHRGKCVKCGWDKIIVSGAVEFDGQDVEQPMSVTYEPRWVLSSRNPKYGHGQLQMLTCQRCGYTEWYAANPDSIPLGEEYGTRLLGAPERAEAAGRVSVVADDKAGALSVSDAERGRLSQHDDDPEG